MAVAVAVVPAIGLAAGLTVVVAVGLAVGLAISASSVLAIGVAIPCYFSDFSALAALNCLISFFSPEISIIKGFIASCIAFFMSIIDKLAADVASTAILSVEFFVIRGNSELELEQALNS